MSVGRGEVEWKKGDGDGPSQVELFAQSEGSHNSDNEGLNRLVDRYENRAAPVNAPDLNRKRYPRSHHPLDPKE